MMRSMRLHRVLVACTAVVLLASCGRSHVVRETGHARNPSRAPAGERPVRVSQPKYGATVIVLSMVLLLTDLDPLTAFSSVLAEAGLIKAHCVRALGAPTASFATRLTFAGHELLDAMRQAGLWNRVKARIRDAGLAMSVEAVRTAVAALIKELLA